MPWSKEYSAIYLYLILRNEYQNPFGIFFLNIKFERRLEKKSCLFPNRAGLVPLKPSNG